MLLQIVFVTLFTVKCIPPSRNNYIIHLNNVLHATLYRDTYHTISSLQFLAILSGLLFAGKLYFKTPFTTLTISGARAGTAIHKDHTSPLQYCIS